jgi:hypothetical protein
MIALLIVALALAVLLVWAVWPLEAHETTGEGHDF